MRQVKNWSLQTSAVTTKWILPLVLLTVSIIADISGADRVIRQLISIPVSPLQNGIIAITSQTLYPLATWQTAWQAQRRVQLLTQQYAEVSTKLAELEQVKAENILLRQIVQATGSSESRRVIAAPITAFGRPALGVGSDQGVQSGNLVFINTILVGRIKETYRTQSIVELLSSQDAQPILAKTESGIEGLIRGDDRRLLLTEIPLNQQLKVGEKVLSVGQLGVPAGLVLGQVSIIENVGAASAQTVILDQLVSFYSEKVAEVRL